MKIDPTQQFLHIIILSFSVGRAKKTGPLDALQLTEKLRAPFLLPHKGTHADTAGDKHQAKPGHHWGNWGHISVFSREL